MGDGITIIGYNSVITIDDIADYRSGGTGKRGRGKAIFTKLEGTNVDVTALSVVVPLITTPRSQSPRTVSIGLGRRPIY